MIIGVKIRTMWMTPFYLFFGVLVVYIFQSQINLNKLKSFVSVLLILFIISPFVYAYISITKTNKRTDYSGKQIARLVESRWNKNFSNEIAYVVGDEWYAGNLSYHLKSRPIWFENIENKTKELNPSGGIIYIGNPDILKQVCPGIYGKIKRQGFCMIGKR
jgi:hypothetical protein